MRPELVHEFIAEYHRELKRLNSTADVDRSRQSEELARVERDIHAIIEAIKSGLRTPSVHTELLALEARKDKIAAALMETQPALVQLRPGHVDGALMVRHHHRHEVAVDVTARLDRHVLHHRLHGRVVCGEEGHFRIRCVRRRILGPSRCPKDTAGPAGLFRRLDQR
jgi:hypothetical protein